MYDRKNYYEAVHFLRYLKRNAHRLTVTQYKTIRRQALSGDIKGAYAAFNRMAEGNHDG